MAVLKLPTPSNEASIMPCRSSARETAWRTRTSLKGGISVRKRHARPGLVPDEPAVRERARDLDAVGCLEHRVEHRRVPAAEGQGAAALWRLRASQGWRYGGPGQGNAAAHQEITTRKIHGTSSFAL